MNTPLESPVQAAATPRPDTITLAAFLLLVLIGGCNAVAVRFSNAEMPPFWGAGLRFSCAALVLWGIVLVRRLPIPGRRDLWPIVLYGALNFGVSYAFLYLGLVHITASLTQIVLAIVPLLSFFLALAHGLEKFRWRGLVGAAVAVAGITLAFVQQSRSDLPLLPLLSLLAGAVCAAEGGIVAKKLPDHSPLVSNAMGMSVGAVLLLILSRLVGDAWLLPTTISAQAAVSYLVLVGSVLMFYLFLFVVQRWTVSATSYLFVLTPFVTVIVAGLLRGESVTPAFLAGGALVLAGVWVGALAPGRASSNEQLAASD